MSQNDIVNDATIELTKQLMDQGRLVAAGFATYRHLYLRDNTPTDVVLALRHAYMVGAEHVWSSMMSTLDAGDEPTAADERRLAMLEQEMDLIRAELQAAHVGNA